MSQSTLRRTAFVVFTVALAAGPLSTSEILAQSTQPSGAGQSVATTPQGPTISISMEDAVKMALESNLGLAADKLGPEIQAQTLSAARAYYNPLFSTTLTRLDNVNAPSNPFDAAATSVTSKTNRFQTSVSQNVKWYGGSYQVTWGGSRSENSSAGNPFNPVLGSSFGVAFNQPLLRNFRIDPNRAAVKANQIQQQISDVILLESIARTARDARLQYLNLVGAIEGRKVAQQNLDLARESLRGDRARVDVGLMAPADITGSEASVADREDALIAAEGNVARAMDQLRQYILDPSRPDYWTAQILPTDTISAEPRQLDVDAAVKAALENRSDLIQARKTIESNRTQLDVLHNATLPTLDFNVNYQGSGTAGTRLEYPNQDYSNPQVVTTKGFTSALSDAFGYAFPNWTYQLVGRYPIIGRSADKASYARAQLQMKQLETNLREAELTVTIQVRDAARQVETSFKRVQTARASLLANEKRLEAEQKRFEVGTSDTFRLFQVQRDVAAQRVAVLQATLAYAQALINFEAVQHIR